MSEMYFRHGGFSPCVSLLWWLLHLLARWSQHISIGSSSLTPIWTLEQDDTVAFVTAIAFLDTDPWFFFFILILDPWSRKVLASMIYILDTVALVTALAVLHMTPKLWIISGCLLAGAFVIIFLSSCLAIFIIVFNTKTSFYLQMVKTTFLFKPKPKPKVEASSSLSFRGLGKGDPTLFFRSKFF